MTDVPDHLTLKRHRDLEGFHRHSIHFRRIVIGLISVFALLGLVNIFGQRPVTIRAVVPKAIVSVYAPTRVRGGVFMEARFHITAKQDIKDAILKLDPGWVEGMSMNTVEPVPINQASDNGRLSFELGHIAKGKSFIFFLQFQINPTNIAWHRPQNVELDDGPQVLAVLHRTITVFP